MVCDISKEWFLHNSFVIGAGGVTANGTLAEQQRDI